MGTLTQAPVREPHGTPGETPTGKDIDAALSCASQWLAGDGSWTPTLRWYCNRWLDKMLEHRGR